MRESMRARRLVNAAPRRVREFPAPEKKPRGAESTVSCGSARGYAPRVAGGERHPVCNSSCRVLLADSCVRLGEQSGRRRSNAHGPECRLSAAVRTRFLPRDLSGRDLPPPRAAPPPSKIGDGSRLSASVRGFRAPGFAAKTQAALDQSGSRDDAEIAGRILHEWETHRAIDNRCRCLRLLRHDSMNRDPSPFSESLFVNGDPSPIQAPGRGNWVRRKASKPRSPSQRRMPTNMCAPAVMR
jgi:hypothetical protein